MAYRFLTRVFVSHLLAFTPRAFHTFAGFFCVCLHTHAASGLTRYAPHFRFAVHFCVATDAIVYATRFTAFRFHFHAHCVCISFSPLIFFAGTRCSFTCSPRRCTRPLALRVHISCCILVTGFGTFSRIPRRHSNRLHTLVLRFCTFAVHRTHTAHTATRLSFFARCAGFCLPFLDGFVCGHVAPLLVLRFLPHALLSLRCGTAPHHCTVVSLLSLPLALLRFHSFSSHAHSFPLAASCAHLAPLWFSADRFPRFPRAPHLRLRLPRTPFHTRLSPLLHGCFLSAHRGIFVSPVRLHAFISRVLGLLTRCVSRFDLVAIFWTPLLAPPLPHVSRRLRFPHTHLAAHTLRCGYALGCCGTTAAPHTVPHHLTLLARRPSLPASSFAGTHTAHISPNPPPHRIGARTTRTTRSLLQVFSPSAPLFTPGHRDCTHSVLCVFTPRVPILRGHRCTFHRYSPTAFYVTFCFTVFTSLAGVFTSTLAFCTQFYGGIITGLMLRFLASFSFATVCIFTALQELSFTHACTLLRNIPLGWFCFPPPLHLVFGYRYLAVYRGSFLHAIFICPLRFFHVLRTGSCLDTASCAISDRVSLRLRFHFAFAAAIFCTGLHCWFFSRLSHTDGFPHVSFSVSRCTFSALHRTALVGFPPHVLRTLRFASLATELTGSRFLVLRLRFDFVGSCTHAFIAHRCTLLPYLFCDTVFCTRAVSHGSLTGAPHCLCLHARFASCGLRWVSHRLRHGTPRVSHCISPFSSFRLPITAPAHVELSLTHVFDSRVC